jgi:formate hydrogenlyase transcriptional activator
MASISQSVAQFNPHAGDLLHDTTRFFPADDAVTRGGETPADEFLDKIIGRRAGLRLIFSQLKAVAPTNVTVLITGETGTGKELIAQAIHELSPRRSRNLVKVNCAAMPSGLLESELFGHERGAFTGAVNSHVGRFSLADRGTLFLDEIGDMPLESQPKILRVLQEREFEAIGSTRTTKVDVRVIAATNQDLQQMVSNQEFREDLFYRLHIFPIFLPPLRERKTDIAGLVTHFVKQFSVSMNKDIRTISDRTMRSMINHSWPGNVRELQNYVARGVILARGTTFDLIPPDKRVTLRAEPTSEKLEDMIRAEILAACHKANWQIGGSRGAAARLGLKRTTLFYKMKRLGISPPAKPF